MSGEARGHLMGMAGAWSFVVALSLVSLFSSIASGTVGGFFFAWVVGALGIFGGADISLEQLEKEKRKNPPRLQPGEPGLVQPRLIAMAYGFGFALLFLGASLEVVIPLWGEPVYRIGGLGLSPAMAGILWIWLMMSTMHCFERRIVSLYVRAGAPRPMLAMLGHEALWPLRLFPFLNPLEWLLRGRERLLGKKTGIIDPSEEE